MKHLAASIAGLALSAAPALAQYPVMAPALYPYAMPVRPMTWVAPQPMVYYVPQPYVQVVPVPVAKVQAAGVLTPEGIYPLDGYRPQVPTATPSTAKATTPTTSAKQPVPAAPNSTGVLPVSGWNSSILPWARRDNPSQTAVSGSVSTSVRQDLGPATK
ncbi:MAG: hypothetical protein U0744_14770 [Gemmataceae bacterium]